MQVASDADIAWGMAALPDGTLLGLAVPLGVSGTGSVALCLLRLA